MSRTISAAVARRYLVLHHLLAPARALPPTHDSVMQVFAHLGSLQFDPLDIAGRNHDLALLARIRGYRRELTEELLYEKRLLYETYNKSLCLVPTAELPWYRLAWELSRNRGAGALLREHREVADELLAMIRERGPLASIDIPKRALIDWQWGPTNQVRAVLEALAFTGDLGLSRRDGNRRYYDLTDRLFPESLLAQRRQPEEQWRHRLLSRFRAHGLLGSGANGEVWLLTGPTAADRARQRDELVRSGNLSAVSVEGLRGTRYVPSTSAGLLDRAEAEVAAGAQAGGEAPTVALLAPLDPLVWDRQLLRSLFGFDYVWEVYVPAAKRRWGYYVLPLLFGDRLVGRIEPRIDRRTGTLHVHGLWWEAGFDPLREAGFIDAFAAALSAHAAFGAAQRITFATPRSALARALRAALSSAPVSPAR